MLQVQLEAGAFDEFGLELADAEEWRAFQEQLVCGVEELGGQFHVARAV